MALAPYFGKAALGAAAFLKETNAEEFSKLVVHWSVTIRFGEEAARTTEGRTCLELLTNLLSRFYPAIGFDPRGKAASELADSLKDQALKMNPLIEVIAPQAPYVVVGRLGDVSSEFTIFVGSEGWTCHFSTCGERRIGLTNNPFGAAAAACFAAAGIFRHRLDRELGVRKVEEEFALSMQDYTRRDAEVSGVDCNCEISADLGKFALVGAGAIGNATVWALSKTKCIGHVDIVDPETVDESNPQRYILTHADSAGTDKVSLAKRALECTSLTVDANKMSWGQFACKNSWDSKLAVVSLDSGEDRIAIQASLPKYILNAWTQANDLGVSRHAFSSESACLACLYWPTRSRANEDELVMKAINFTGQLMEIRNMLYHRTPLDQNWLERLSRDLGQPIERLTPFLGKTLDTFYREGICGGQIVATAHGTIVVPMAFQSALAGVMLAREIVAYGELDQVVDTKFVTTKIDMLRPLGTHLSEEYKKRTDVSCICSDDDFLERYQSKFA